MIDENALDDFTSRNMDLTTTSFLYRTQLISMTQILFCYAAFSFLKRGNKKEYESSEYISFIYVTPHQSHFLSHRSHSALHLQNNSFSFVLIICNSDVKKNK
jgi:hypothetical protein